MGLFGVDVSITEGAKTWAPVYHKPYETYMPSYQLDYQYAPSMMIESPGATGATMTTKKEATQTPTQTAPVVTAPTTGQTTDPTGILLLLGVIAVGGYVAVSLIKRKKK